MSESVDVGWIKWALAAISAAGAAIGAHLRMGQNMQTARVDAMQKAHDDKMDSIRQKISDSHDNAVRDIWQALEADRKASQQYREVVLTGLAKAATKDDLAVLGREIAAQFQRRKDA